MNTHYSQTRKIDPSRGSTLADGSPNDNDRVEIGPTRLAYAEWEAAGLTLPDLPAMRAFRHRRLTDAVNARDWGGILMFDPLNIRYATDSTNMQLWNTHNAFRACLVCADGYMVIWDYKNGMFLSAFNPLVREQRSGADLFYFDRGDKVGVAADVFAQEVRDLIAEHSGGNMRLGVDKIMLHGLRSLERAGFMVMEGEELTEKTRAIKGPDEILAMRCASHACEASVRAMEDFARANVPHGQTSEDDIWAVLHAENIKRGGEWIETRLLASGPRTNPWFQECGPRVVQMNEIVAFDTDLIGAYGICVDISRSWWIGDRAAPARHDRDDEDRARAHRHQHGAPETRRAPARPDLQGAHSAAASATAEIRLPHARRRPLRRVAVDLLSRPVRRRGLRRGARTRHVHLRRSFGQPEGGDFSIKLEDQVLITEDGFENLTHYPFDAALMGQ
jgi:Xaa-Pro dipeptidase